MRDQDKERDLVYNYCALVEVIFSQEGVLPEKILKKYGLLDISDELIESLEREAMERMKAEEGLTYKEIGRRLGLSESGVFRRMHNNAYCKSKTEACDLNNVINQGWKVGVKSG